MIKKEDILSRINFRSFYQEHIPDLNFHNGNAQIMGLCPFHEDKKPSLSVNIKNGYFKCFSCGAEGDLFTFYQKIKGVDFKTTLSDLGRSVCLEDLPLQKVVSIFEYKSSDGKILYRKERLEPGRNGQKKEFRFSHNKDGRVEYGRGCETTLYNLMDVVKSKYIFILEGEAKSDLLKSWGLTGTTLDSGACSPWQDSYLQYFENKSVYILPDNDKPGMEFALRVANTLCHKVKTLKIVNLPGLAEKGDIVDWAKMEENTKEKLLGIIEQSPVWVPESKISADWELPILLDEHETPDIPARLLPCWSGDFAKEIAQTTETPEAMAVFITLGIISAAVSKRFVVSPKPGWNEPVNIYALIALPPANHKSKVLTECTRPLIEWEKEKTREFEPVIQRAISDRKTLEARIDLLRKQAVREKEFFERQILQNEIFNLENSIAEIPALPKLFANDITPESLTTQLAEQAGRFAVIGDEGGIFEVISGLYSGGSANIDVVLKGIDGGEVRVRRKDKTCDLNPYLTFAMAVQPIIIQNMNSKKVFSGNGMLERFLYVLPKSRLGYRTHDKAPVPEIVKTAYNREIKNLLDIPPLLNDLKEEIPRTLTLEPHAYKEWRRFQDYIETQLRPDGRLYSLLGWGGKLCGYTLRLAGLLHCAEYGESKSEINNSTMKNALEISERLIEHAIAAFSLSGVDEPTEDAKVIFQWIKSLSELSFKQRDCHNKFQGRFPSLEKLLIALRILNDRNIISSPVKVSKNGGRPSVVYNVNPKIFDKK